MEPEVESRAPRLRSPCELLPRTKARRRWRRDGAAILEDSSEKACPGLDPASAGRPVFGRHLKPGEVEAGRDRAAGQRPVAEAFGGLPCVGGHDRLRALARREIGAEPGA